MTRRIEIELTSARSDGTWTWRAAGAKQPRGVVDGALLAEGAKAGDVLHAEAEFEIDGITIVSVLPPKPDSRSEPQRIEVLGPTRPEPPGVTTQLAGKRSGPRAPERRGDGASQDARRPPRERTAGSRGPRGDEARPGRAGRPDRNGRPREDAPRHPRRSPEETERADGPRVGASPDPVRTHRRHDRRSATRSAAQRDAFTTTAGRSGRSASPPEPRTRAHRQAALESLPPEQKPVAEQVLRGGIPAVRTALHLEKEKALAEGRPPPNSEELLALAEQLLPRLKAAEWRDRAEAAVKHLDTIGLRDLRSVVAGADAARDDDTRSLAATLREALDRRIDASRVEWAGEIAAHLDAGKVVPALRQSARPPDASTRLESDLAVRLAEAASAAMTAATPNDTWLALLDAAAESPVRREVKPEALAADASPELRRAAHQQSGRIPALAAMLGVAIPPPPGPPRARRPARSAETGAPPARERTEPRPGPDQASRARPVS